MDQVPSAEPDVSPADAGDTLKPRFQSIKRLAGVPSHLCLFLPQIIASQVNSKLVIKSKGLPPGTPREDVCPSPRSSHVHITYFERLVPMYVTFVKGKIQENELFLEWILLNRKVISLFISKTGFTLSRSLFAARGTSQKDVLCGAFLLWLPVPFLQVLFLLHYVSQCSAHRRLCIYHELFQT